MRKRLSTTNLFLNTVYPHLLETRTLIRMHNLRAYSFPMAYFGGILVRNCSQYLLAYCNIFSIIDLLKQAARQRSHRYRAKPKPEVTRSWQRLLYHTPPHGPLPSTPAATRIRSTPTPSRPLSRPLGSRPPPTPATTTRSRSTSEVQGSPCLRWLSRRP